MARLMSHQFTMAPQTVLNGLNLGLCDNDISHITLKIYIYIYCLKNLLSVKW